MKLFISSIMIVVGVVFACNVALAGEKESAGGSEKVLTPTTPVEYVKQHKFGDKIINTSQEFSVAANADGQGAHIEQKVKMEFPNGYTIEKNINQGPYTGPKALPEELPRLPAPPPSMPATWPGVPSVPAGSGGGDGGGITTNCYEHTSVSVIEHDGKVYYGPYGPVAVDPAYAETTTTNCTTCATTDAITGDIFQCTTCTGSTEYTDPVDADATAIDCQFYDGLTGETIGY